MHKALLAAIIAFGGLQGLADQAVVGRVLREDTSTPIEGARVSLTRFPPDLPLTDATRQGVGLVAFSLQNRSSPDFLKGLLTATALVQGISEELLKPVYAASTVTDYSGSFRFTELAPGRYVLAIEREGYFAHEGVADGETLVTRIITIEPGTKPAAVDLLMVEGGSISGRIRDPLGQPGADIVVSAYRASYRDGVKLWEPAQLSDITDDLGEFRLSPAFPGQYLVAAVPPPGLPARKMNWQDSWAQTFYPGSDYPLTAVPVTVDFGQEVRAINIDILKVDPMRTYTISGTAINPLGLNPTTGSVDRSVGTFYLISREPSLLKGPFFPIPIRNAIPVGSRPNGEFEIRNVKPGAYDLYAASGSFIGRAPVDVLDQDVRGLSIAISPGGTLEVVIESGADTPIRLDSLQLELRKLDTTPITIPSGQKFDAAGRVVLQNFPEARYRLSLRGLPADAYIADIRQGGRSVHDEGIVVGQRLESVRISVKTDSGAITGSVERSGKGVPKATVILVPPAARRKNPQLFRTATTNEEGGFSMRGVMPGVYTIVAIRSLPVGEPWLNETFLEPFLQRAQELRIDARSTVPVRLELIAN